MEEHDYYCRKIAQSFFATYLNIGDMFHSDIQIISNNYIIINTIYPG